MLNDTPLKIVFAPTHKFDEINSNPELRLILQSVGFLLNIDFDDGFFSDESTLSDFVGCGLTDDQYNTHLAGLPDYSAVCTAWELLIHNALYDRFNISIRDLQGRHTLITTLVHTIHKASL